MILRPYQQRAVDAIRSALGRHRAVCLAAQVGSGKTVIACEIIRRVLDRGNRALFLVHRVELVEQARDRLRAFDIEAGIIKAGFAEDRAQPVQVACIPTLIRREFPPAELVIFDECHHAVSESWLRVLAHYRDAGAWILGITATPQRLDGKPLGEAFETIIEPVTTRELIDDGYLIEPVVYAPPSIDRRGLKVQGGDFALPQLAERMQKLTASITDYWSDHAGDRTLCFAVNIAHSQRIAEALIDVGARVAHIDGGTPPGRRALVNRMFRVGEFDVVTQCQVWTEGFDLPELDTLIVARPTKSLGLHRQMIGRVMRPAPGKDGAIVLDHAGNHHEHGAITAEIEWSLDGKPKREGVAPVRTCSTCFAIIPLASRTCPECGAELDEDVEPPKVENPGELERLATDREEERRADWYVGQVRIASASGYALGWARFRYKEQFGKWPRLWDIEDEEYDCRCHDFEERKIGYRRVTRCRLCYAEKPHAARI